MDTELSVHTNRLSEFNGVLSINCKEDKIWNRNNPIATDNKYRIRESIRKTNECTNQRTESIFKEVDHKRNRKKSDGCS